ncbi:uncharacterized protein VTP21DRAFT_9149 [Calcarisporiella thermophila]|uniref:uncharacterized protein n=1 Tax=Calcarisporiella thermophila TaxID=911321 RepID=UPI0037438BDE
MSDVNTPAAHSGVPSTPAGRMLTSSLRSDALRSGSSLRDGLSTPRSRRGDIHIPEHLTRSLDQISLSGGATSVAEPTSDASQTERVIWGTTVNLNDSLRAFKDFLINFKLADRKALEGEEIRDVDREPFYPKLLNQIREAEVNNLNLDCRNLLAYSRTEKLYHQLLRYPQEIIPLMDYTLGSLFLEMFGSDAEDQSEKLKVRPFNLGRMVNMRNLNPADVDQLVTIKGLVIRTTPIIPDMKRAFFRCLHCETTVVVELDRGRVEEPINCSNANCKATNMYSLIHNRSEFADKQVCRLQETPDVVPDGQTPLTISLCIYDDLVDVARPGDHLEVTGIFRSVPIRVNPRQRTLKSLFKTYIDVVHIKRTGNNRLGFDNTLIGPSEAVVEYEEGDEIHIETEERKEIEQIADRSDVYELLARSLAPSIYEMEDVKKAILLQLFGGTVKTFTKSASPKYRGDINLLLVGDPGTSKSQILQYVHKIAPRGIYTSGKGSSAVGLTAYVTRDPDTRQLVLESGALVLSDGGVCCIDEFDKMSDSTRAILHEVMEQQTVSVAKAGIITSLNARTSILACANPIKSNYDVNMSIPQNVNLPPTLLSRFDLIFLILDKVDETNDRRLARHIVQLYYEDMPTRGTTLDVIPTKTLTKYITYARKYIHPVISEAAAQSLVDHYVQLRKAGQGDNRIMATTRQLESLIRLAEARARMRLSGIVDVEDIDEATRLYREALKESATDPRTGLIDLDLVQLGHSNHDRRVFEDMLREVKRLLLSQERDTVLWTTAFQAFNEQATVKVKNVEFERALIELERQGTLKLTGSGSTRTIRMLVNQQEAEFEMGR